MAPAPTTSTAQKAEQPSPVAHMALEKVISSAERASRSGQVGGHHIDRPAHGPLAQPSRLLSGVPAPGAIEIRVNGDEINVAVPGCHTWWSRREPPSRTVTPHTPGPGQRLDGLAGSQRRRNSPGFGKRHRHSRHPTGAALCPCCGNRGRGGGLILDLPPGGDCPRLVWSRPIGLSCPSQTGG